MAKESGSHQFSGDSVLFQGPKLPVEVRKMIPLLAKVKFDNFKKVLHVVCCSVQRSDVDSASLQNVYEEIFPGEREKVDQLISGLYTIIKATLRQPAIKQDIYKAELLSMKFPENFVEQIIKNTFGDSRMEIEKCLLRDRIRLPGLDSLKWRVDVGISTSSLNRVLVPTILMEIKSTDGSVKSFEVSLAKFNELEYDIAYILKEMEDLEKRSILKIE